jgi:glycosyltransferase involved in cell wall biosynthesis
MKLAFVSSYPPMHCGMGEYTRALARDIVKKDKGTEIAIIGEEGSAITEESGLTSRPVYRRDERYQDKILNEALAKGVDLVHFQHASDLFGEDERLPDLMGRLRQAGIKTAVTLHTVHAERPFMKPYFTLTGKPTAEWFYQEIGRNCDRIVLHHHDGMVDRLEELGLPREHLAVIPHGTDILPELDPRQCRIELGLKPDATVLLFFGFIHLQKNIHVVVEGFRRVAKSFPDAILFIVGKPFHNYSYNRAYAKLLRNWGHLAGEGRVIVREEFVPSDLIPKLFAASDVLLLPHWQRYGSASGVFHRAIGAKKPIICSKGPKFEDGMKLLKDYPELVPSPMSFDQWAVAMRALLADPALRSRIQEIFRHHAEATSWERVAEQHLAVYRGALGQ